MSTGSKWLCLGVAMFAAGWLVEHAVLSATLVHASELMAVAELEAQLEVDTRKEMRTLREEGSTEEDTLLHERVSSVLRDQAALRELEAEQKVARGGASALNDYRWLSRLHPLLVVLEILGVLLVLMSLLGRQPESVAGKRFAVAAGVGCVVLVCADTSALLPYQIAGQQAVLFTFSRAVSDHEAVAAKQMQYEEERLRLDEMRSTFGESGVSTVVGVDELVGDSAWNDSASEMAAIEESLRLQELEMTRERELFATEMAWSDLTIAIALGDGAGLRARGLGLDGKLEAARVLALTGTKAELQAASPALRLWALALRADKGELADLSSDELLNHLLNDQLSILEVFPGGTFSSTTKVGPESMGRLTLGDASSYTLHFVEQGETVLWDAGQDFSVLDAILVSEAQHADLPLDDSLLERIQRGTGQPLDEPLWTP